MLTPIPAPRKNQVSLLIDSIGNTPLIDISALIDRPGIKLLAKLEGNNPGTNFGEYRHCHRHDRCGERVSGQTGDARLRQYREARHFRSLWC